MSLGEAAREAAWDDGGGWVGWMWKLGRVATWIIVLLLSSVYRAGRSVPHYLPSQNASLAPFFLAPVVSPE